MLSIIIPTLNEENYLPLVLASIKSQQSTDCEIIVADAGSTDKTLEIAYQYNCIVCPGGLPAKGRNNGAQVARGELLFFLDSDTILPEHFFKKALGEFATRHLDIASFCLHPYPEKVFSRLMVNIFYNYMIVALEKILPHAATGIIIKKNLFEKLHGYDETITLSEDHDLGRRAAKIAKFGIIRSVEIFVSDRRSKTDGWVTTGIKYFLCELHTIFIGPVRSNIFHYKFAHYKKNEK